MTKIRISTVFGIVALSLASLALVSPPARAASAHNSQAGADGGTSDNAAPLHTSGKQQG